LSTSAMPITASSEQSCQASKPSARSIGPPTPANSASGKRCLSSRTRPAASRSPEASPATRANRRGRPAPAMTASAQQAALAALDELEHQLHVLRFAGALGQLRAGLGQGFAGHVQGAVGALDRRDALGIEAAALQAFAVDAARRGVTVGYHQEGRHVAVDQAAHADEGMRTDGAELVDAGKD